MRRHLLPTLLLTGALCGCKTPGAKPAEVSHPEPGASSPTRASCQADAGVLRPLLLGASDAVVRAMRESSARGGIVVSYGCAGLEVLEDCWTPGSYAFANITSEQSRIRIESSAEAVINLPLSEEARNLASGEALEVNLLSKARLSMTLDGVYGDELRGRCAKASHFVRAMEFGFSSTAGSVKKLQGSCEFAGGWPTGCAPIRLHVQKIDAHRGPSGWSKHEVGTERSPCPEAMVWTGDACSRQRSPTVDSPGVPSDLALMKRACDEGLASSCRELGLGATGLLKRNLLMRACELGDARACGASADLLLERSEEFAGESAEGRVDEELGYAAWRQACEGGLASRCWSWGLMAQAEPSKSAGFDAYSAWVRGCQRGSRESCYQAVASSMKRGGNAKEELPLLEAACAGDEPSWEGCLELARRIEGGRLEATPVTRAQELYQRVCEMKVKKGCREAARLAREAGTPERASEWLGRACVLGDVDACLDAAESAGKDGAGDAKRWHQEGCERFRHPPSCDQLKKL